MKRITADWLHSPASQIICRMLTDAGYQAWFVGGCVRNALLQAPVADLDISTNARPEQVLALGQAAGLKTIPTGMDHGTITVVADGLPFEITTFRKDVATDGRRAVVAFADTMSEDALRRDFTMNALYADPTGQVADPLGGLPDLAARRVRFIEDPDQRIKEDYLRILRFFRFHAWYGDPSEGIDADGLAACAENVAGIAQLSRERVGLELLKLLAAPDPAPAVASFAACGGLAQALPGAEHGMLAPLVHVEQAAGLKPHPLRRLAMLAQAEIADSLRLSKKQITTLQALQTVENRPAYLAQTYGAETAIDILAVQSASLGQRLSQDQITEVQDAALQHFPLSAADLMPAFQGVALGAALQKAKAAWLASGCRLSKDALLAVLDQN